MANITAQRVATLIQRELASIVNLVIKDDHIGYINITEVKLSKDKSFATIYYSILADDNLTKEKCVKELNNHLPTIKKELAKKLKNLRRQPELIFKYDEALAYGNHIDKLLKELK